jgi:predicted DNA-binding protein YlxM (UPF0122 family)
VKDVARRAYLLDFYGALLTDKQRDIYEWYYQQDLSLGEISEVANVSRNAVYDLVSRTNDKLERYERALGLVAAGERQLKDREDLAGRLESWLEAYGGSLDAEAKETFSALIGRIRA